MKRFEYKTVDLIPTWSLNLGKKTAEYLERLDKLGQEGWTLISGNENWKYSLFVREIEETL